MIKVTADCVEVHGSFIQLQAELTVLIRSFLDNGFDKEDIDLCVETATLSDAELTRRAKKTLKNLFDELFEE